MQHRDHMQKVKLITIKEIPVYPDQMTVEVAPPLPSIHDVPIPGMGPTEDLCEVREQVPINTFRRVDRIPVQDREMRGLSIDELVAKGYKISQEDNTFEKVFEHKMAMTVEARQFLDMEEEVIRDLKRQNESLDKRLSLATHDLKWHVSRVKQLEEEKENRWIEKVKRFFSKK